MFVGRGFKKKNKSRTTSVTLFITFSFLMILLEDRLLLEQKLELKNVADFSVIPGLSIVLLSIVLN